MHVFYNHSNTFCTTLLTAFCTTLLFCRVQGILNVTISLEANIAHILAIETLHVLYHLLTIEEGVKEVDKQFLIWVCAEDSLKAEIGQQTDISFF